MLRAMLSLTFCVQMAADVLQAQNGPPPRYVSSGGYLGGTGDDVAFAVDGDAEGNIYVCGRTNSLDFLSFAGFTEIISAGGADAAVVKLSPDGSEVLAAAALQGPGYDIAVALSVLADGRVAVAGEVSAGFTPPGGACRPDVSGASDVFVALYDSELELIAFELIGGTGQDIANDLDVDADGTITLLGATNSTTGLLTTPGAYQETYLGGESDFFVARLRLDADVPCDERLKYLTYLGSAGMDNNFPTRTDGALHVGVGGLVTVAGTTWSPGTFPTTPNAYRAPVTGESEVFVAQLWCDASLGDQQLVYAAVLGGSSTEVPKSVDVSGAGAIRVMGWTWSLDFPRTESEAHHGDNDIYIAVLFPSRDPPPEEQLKFGAFIQGSRYDPPYVGVPLPDPDGALLVGGLTISANFPSTPDAIGVFRGVNEQACALVVRTESGLSATDRIPFSTALTPGSFCSGGNWDNCDRVYGLAVAPDGSILACGPTSGPISAASKDAAQSLPAGGADWFVYRLDLRRPKPRLALTPDSGPAPLEVCAAASGSSTPAGTLIESFTYDFGGGADAVTRHAEEEAVCHRYEVAGVYEVGLTVTNDRDLVASASGTVRVDCGAGELSPWTTTDIGAVQIAGGVRRLDPGEGDPKCLAICSAGGSLAGREDALSFVHRELAGDGTLSARIEAIEATSPAAAVGLMWRESGDPGARYTTIITERNGRLAFRHRQVFAGTSQRVNGAIVPFPIEIRIERRGDVFTGSARAASDEDAAWIVVGSATLKDFSMEGSGALPLAGVFATAAISSATPTFTALTAEVCDLELIEPTEPPRFHRGDPNASGTTDISDGVDIFGFLFLGGTVPTCRESADVNNNGEIDLTDGISLLNWLFLGGPPPAAPGPTTADCGVDPDEPGSPGDLSCEAYAPCS